MSQPSEGDVDETFIGVGATEPDALDRRLKIGRPEFGDALDGLRARLSATARGLAPQTVGRHRLGRVLGSGAFGTVYEAEDPQLDRKVAVKVLTVRSGKEAARVLREAQLLATLSHPNIVQVFEVGTIEEGRSLYVVMELVEGATLRQWLDEGPRTWREVVDVVLGAGQGLWAAHRAGIVHRDFKPDNVLIGADGRPRVIDFGLARALGGVDESSSGTTLPSGASPQLTATGQVMGTPAYMAPEGFAGEHSPASDQYALCVTLYEALLGERPFAAESPEALARKVLAQEVEPPADRRGVPRRVIAIALRGLRRSTRERFGDVGELVAALEGVLRPRRWPAAVAGLAVLGISGLVVTGMQPRPELPAAEACAVGEAAFARLREPVTIPPEVDEPLASFQRTWLETEQALCAAGSLGWEQRRCLDRGLRDAAALVSLLGEPNADAAEIAAALQRSPSPADCADPTRDDVTPPPVGLELDPLEQRLSNVRALAYTAKITEGLQLSEPLVEDVRAAGYPPLMAEAMHLRGRLLLLGSDYDGARAMYEEAFFLAQQSGPRWIAGWTAAELLRISLMGHEDLEAARRWAEHAEIALRRAGFDPLEHHVYVDALASLYEREGKQEEAIQLLRQGIASEQARGEFNGGLANRLGVVHYARDEYHEAIAALRLAAAKFEELHGPDSPSVAAAIDSIGACLVALGHYRAAYEHNIAALKIREATLAADHIQLGQSYGNMGEVLRELGRHDEALAYLDRALALFTARLGGEHLYVAMTHHSRARVHEQRGPEGLEPALREYERAARLFEALGPQHAEDAERMRSRMQALTAPEPSAP